MDKLTTKNAFLIDAKYDFIRDGSQRGVYALQVKLGDAAKFDPSALAEIVMDAARRKWPARRVVRFYGNVDFSQHRILMSMQAFRDRGFEVQVDLTSQPEAPVPRDIVAWSVLRTSETVVLASHNEIIYSPTKEDIESGKLTKFNCPLAGVGVTFLWLNVASGAATFEQVRDFLCESKLSWQVAI
jgi:hypothetical protein